MADSTERKIWEQQEGEPNEAYARFLVYRNLGPARTIDAAYKASVGNRRKSSERSGQWGKNSIEYSWKERAAAWDAAQLVNAVPEAATTIFKLMSEIARVTLEEIASGNIKPKTFDEAREMVTILASFISPEVISQTIDNAGVPRVESGKPTVNPGQQ